MIRSLPLSMIILTALASMVIGVSWGQKPPLPDNFSGKVVTVYLTTGQQMQGLVLEHVELKDVGGRKFLVGIGADTKDADNAAKGVEVGIAWESVAVYIAMTRDQFDAKLKDKQ